MHRGHPSTLERDRRPADRRRSRAGRRPRKPRGSRPTSRDISSTYRVTARDDRSNDGGAAHGAQQSVGPALGRSATGATAAAPGAGGPPPWVQGLIGLAQSGGRRVRRRGPRGPKVRRGDVRAAILDVLAVRADERLPDHPADRRAQRRGVEAEPRLGLPDRPAARGRGARRGPRRRGAPAAPAHRGRSPLRRGAPRRAGRAPGARSTRRPTERGGAAPATSSRSSAR